MYAFSMSSPARARLVRSRASLGLLLLVPCGVMVALSRPIAREGTWLDLGFDVAGLVVFLVGAVFRMWATLYIGGRKNRQLVSEGPYSICRNPLYFGTFLMTASVAFFLESITFAAVLAATAWLYLRITVPYEEQHLRDLLGQPYLDYCRRVPRFWPRLRSLRTDSTVEVNLPNLLTECRRALVWIWIPALGEAVAYLRAESWWPAVFRLP